jgi:hypothetical protein
MFEEASKLKLRYDTPRGAVTTEDLWDLPLLASNGNCLDAVARHIHKRIKESEEESFVTKKSPEDSLLLLKMNVVKRIIEVKLEEKTLREKRAANAAKRATIMAILAEKQEDELKSKSVKSLKDMLDGLGE